MKAFRYVALCSLFVAVAGRFPLTAADQPMIGEAAPAFDLPALSGGRVALEDYRDKIVVLHFGAGW